MQVTQTGAFCRSSAPARPGGLDLSLGGPQDLTVGEPELLQFLQCSTLLKLIANLPN